MAVIHGFEVLEERDIKELNTLARVLRHVKTGARLLSLSNNDENKVFGITFRTPPVDSSGVAHILEHSVLCGSRKYPVKEPFVELLKGSLNTFLNAFTYPDRTSYPVASQNLQDFYNLIDVYLDAVFYPRLNPFVFQQEGWHFELNSPDKPLSIKGVVFNEMKGAYSSPENLLSEYSMQSLFPDTTYGFDSGGDPKKIPDLTFEQFKEFHRRYYHPSNAWIYFYGDDDPDRRLKFLDQVLKNFNRTNVDSRIPLQPPFDQPRRIIKPFMVDEGENEASQKGMTTVNWLLCEGLDIKTNFSLQMLEYILLGMPGSPLRKALIDSGLGEGIAGVGLENELRQLFFSTGLKGVKIEDMEKVEPLILETLDRLGSDGIDPKTVDAALNSIEFRLRENNSGHFPRGLVLMLRALTTWLYDGDPLAILSFEKPLEEIKTTLKTNDMFFEKIINRFFLKNKHRTSLLLKPDPNMKQKEYKEEQENLQKIQANLDKREIEELVNNTKELNRIQGTADTPEALATIPLLKLSDLERKNRSIPLVIKNQLDVPVLSHDLFTNGILYLDIGFDLHPLPGDYLQYVRIFGHALTHMGTEKEDFVSLTQRISRKTGGITTQIFTSTIRNTGISAARLFMRSKAVVNNTGDLIDILHDMLLSPRLQDRDRFRQIVLEEKARLEQALIPKGHQYVNLRIRSHLSDSGWAAEQVKGISYLFFIRDLIKAVDENWDKVLEILREVHRILVNRKNIILNITTAGTDLPRVEPHIDALLGTIPETPVTKGNWSYARPTPFEGMTIPSRINFVGKGANLYNLGYGFHGSSLVITRYLRNSWLWDRVRVNGGAYGAFCLFDHLSGGLTFVSYRDPNLIKTLEIFDQSARFLHSVKLDGKELTKAIIGAIGDIDAHMLPDAKGFVSMTRYLTKNTDEARQKMREEVLETRKDDFRAFADVLDQVKEKGIAKVMGAENAIRQEMIQGTKKPIIVKVL